MEENREIMDESNNILANIPGELCLDRAAVTKQRARLGGGWRVEELKRQEAVGMTDSRKEGQGVPGGNTGNVNKIRQKGRSHGDVFASPRRALLTG